MAVVKGKKREDGLDTLIFFFSLQFSYVAKKVDSWNKSVKRKTLVHQISFFYIFSSLESRPTLLQTFSRCFQLFFIYGPESSGKSVNTTETSALKFTAKLPSLKVIRL